MADFRQPTETGDPRRAAEELLRRVLDEHGDGVALASSMGAEDQVLTDMLCRLTDAPRVFTLDTGRLPQETHNVIEATHKRYGLRIEVFAPDAADVEVLVNECGPNCFRESVGLRKRCCRVRKVLPLLRALSGLTAWITGLRREQAATRTALAPAQWDKANGLWKISPLADWSSGHIWQYIRDNDVPYNALHDRGYPSIGCGPCTRAVADGDDIRSGRWWWEEPEQKECGLHLADGKLARAKKE